MTTAAALLLVVAAAAVVALGPLVAVAVLARRPGPEVPEVSLLADRGRRQVLVTLKSGAAFRGVLYATDREALVLREAQALAYGAQKATVPVEGELVALRADVDYLQVLPSGAVVPS
jgi:small nuclear ribonucleoprotein (snRNP)-like protein